MEASSKIHALVMPLPGQGHINPMLSLSLHLASRCFLITFLITEEGLGRIKPYITAYLNEAGLTIRFSTIPGPHRESPSPPASVQVAPGSQSFKELLEGVESQQASMEEMVLMSRSTPHPITCIISDSFIPWTQPLANKLGLAHVIFWTISGMALASLLEMRSGKFIPPMDDVGCNDDDKVETGGVIMKRSEFLATIPFRQPEALNRFKARLDGCEHAACIVVNTFEELEASSLEASTSETRVRYVGPLLPPDLGKSGTISASLYEEQRYCLQWLDKQVEGSVLFISFGSEFSLSELELEEVAACIKESKQPFLWVIRDGCPTLPQEFLEQTSGYGFVIKWAPQTQVLNHEAVGGFLTHCGWNSAMESIYMGVPMLCYPISRDQHINALLIVKQWKLGVAVEKGEHGVVSRDNVRKALATLMHSQDIRERAARMKEASHLALQQGGSSYNALQSFILDVKQASGIKEGFKNQVKSPR